MATLSSATRKNLGLRTSSCGKRKKRAIGGETPFYPFKKGGMPKIEIEKEVKVKNRRGRTPKISIDREVKINGRGVKSANYADAKAQYLATGGQARHGQSFNDWYRENHGFGDWVKGAWNTVKRGASSLWKNRDRIKDTAQNFLNKYDQYAPKAKDLAGGRGQKVFDYLDRGRQKVKHHTGYKNGGHALVPYADYQRQHHGFGSFIKGVGRGIKKVFKPVVNVAHTVSDVARHLPIVGPIAGTINKGTGAIKTIGGFKHGGMPVPYGAYENHGFGDVVRGLYNKAKKGISSLWNNRDKIISKGKDMLGHYDKYSPMVRQHAGNRGEKFLNLLDKGREKVRQHTGYAYGGAPGMSYNMGNRMHHDLGAYNRAAYENRMHPNQGFGNAMHHDIENYTHDAEEDGRQMRAFGGKAVGGFNGGRLMGSDPKTWSPTHLQKKKFYPVY